MVPYFLFLFVVIFFFRLIFSADPVVLVNLSFFAIFVVFLAVLACLLLVLFFPGISTSLFLTFLTQFSQMFLFCGWIILRLLQGGGFLTPPPHPPSVLCFGWFFFLCSRHSTLFKSFVISFFSPPPPPPLLYFPFSLQTNVIVFRFCRHSFVPFLNETLMGCYFFGGSFFFWRPFLSKKEFLFFSY